MFLLALHGAQNSLVTGCITDVTQEGGAGEANAENITFQQKFRRGMCREVVQEQCSFTVFYQSSLPATSSCCRYKVVMKPDRKYFSGYPCFLICVTKRRYVVCTFQTSQVLAFPSHCRVYLVYASSIGIPTNSYSVLMCFDVFCVLKPVGAFSSALLHCTLYVVCCSTSTELFHQHRKFVHD